MSQAAVLIIGNEILSGRTQDTNTRHIANRLASKGIYVQETRTVRDEENEIIKAIRELRALYPLVFTTGGIGNTHDDITVASVAAALELPLTLHEEATAIVARHYPQARHQVIFPQGAGLILNSLSHAPGFYINGVYVMAGVPAIMEVMLEDALAALPSYPVRGSINLHADVNEYALAGDMAAVQRDFPMLDIGSYPRYDFNTGHQSVSIVIRGHDRDALHSCASAMRELLSQRTSHITVTEEQVS